MSNYINFRGTAECPHCGYSKAVTTDRDEAKIITDWLEAQGLDPKKEIRDYRASVQGFGFGHGGGYAILDADVLGGDGSGQAQSRFLEETGVAGFHYPARGSGISTKACAECAQWL